MGLMAVVVVVVGRDVERGRSEGFLLFFLFGVPRFRVGISCHHTYFIIHTSSILNFLHNASTDVLLIIGL